MNTHELYQKLELSPVIAAAKNEAELEAAIKSESEVIFILQSHLMELADLSQKIKASGKTAILHADLVKGLSSDETAIDYIKQSTSFDGIISTKPAIIRHAKKHGLLAIQRFFLLDSSALENVDRQLKYTEADLVEVLPSVSPKIIKELVNHSKKPLVVGGLIRDKEDIMGALGAGSLAVSTTESSIWSI
ncbi:glycerol-3-phosphate responsive antiterminator [Enterococcus hulanensis]|uniref:Glycerol uptake operon antiterminator regulatory protein n=1 Tax=Enterococcus hulanensis TaxID=2559929 RepID=A0ABU3EXS7_9ENTE|nr:MULTISPECIES: glycerol-3-phosphate responsive antiterminator [Enterococcus]MBO0412495.1 glycerol-3-phosphate responsive antiterminator [Enterococcus hulanensis]MBX8939030.1 glycerol-3-phosphate responsive antiterminator [Enterococcus gilvus]MDT2599682.1 glycerol-3-phosphate responsive antiterminator [Enterococcus hulanensis]MDT2609462.1 glycerol-3-phosphate responsive antiterminator [Enterococcus hulanensis]MDT2616039.1 glycerol-3-phosphate responsive antiterminator [Enterococcus hulanensis